MMLFEMFCGRPSEPKPAAKPPVISPEIARVVELLGGPVSNWDFGSFVTDYCDSARHTPTGVRVAAYGGGRLSDAYAYVGEVSATTAEAEVLRTALVALRGRALQAQDERRRRQLAAALSACE